MEQIESGRAIRCPHDFMPVVAEQESQQLHADGIIIDQQYAARPGGASDAMERIKGKRGVSSKGSLWHRKTFLGKRHLTLSCMYRLGETKNPLP